tara:strand:+ start:4396 stop:4677 length:282 start_codon:yes stop_codon:yes gene_type:complete
MNLKDFKVVCRLIDDIIGIKTKQGNTLKKAIKNYFDTKPISVKLVAKENISFNIADISRHSKAADEAMERYTEKLKLETEKLKKKGEFCGISG